MLNVTLAPGGDADATTTTVTNLLQLQATSMLYTSDRARGPAPSPGRPRMREEPEMPSDPRDRRTLMIGGGVLGVLLVGLPRS